MSKEFVHAGPAAYHKRLAQFGYTCRQYSPAETKPAVKGLRHFINNKLTGLPYNCKNCGAPLKSTACEYCETRYSCT